MSSYTSNYRRRNLTVRSVTNNTARYNGLGRYAKRAAKSTGTVLRKSTRRVVQGLAKDELFRVAETKYMQYQYANQGIPSGLNFNITAYNVFQPFSNGDLHNNVNGSEIYTLDLQINYVLRRRLTSGADGSPVQARVSLIKSALIWPLASGASPFVPESNIPTRIWTNTSANATTRTFNPNAVSVLGSRIINVQGVDTSGVSNAFTTGVLRFPRIRGKKTFITAHSGTIDVSRGEMKEGNYYILIELYSGTASSASNNISFEYDVMCKFKDI